MKGYYFSIKVYKRVLFLSKIKGKGWTSRVGASPYKFLSSTPRVVTEPLLELWWTKQENQCILVDVALLCDRNTSIKVSEKLSRDIKLEIEIARKH